MKIQIFLIYAVSLFSLLGCGVDDGPSYLGGPATPISPGAPLQDGERPTGTLQNFSQSTNTLPYPVAHAASLQIGTKVYVFGGVKSDPDGSSNPTTTTQILVADIGSDGNIGTFSVSGFSLASARRAMRAVIVGNWVYLIGGYSNTALTDNSLAGTRYTTIERAPIVNNELAGNFSIAAPTLAVPRDNFALLKTNNYVYAIGGKSYESTIDRAPISGGEISGNFVTLTRTVVDGTHVTDGLVSARYTHDLTVIGNTVYVVGGSDPGGTSLNSIEEAQIQSDGTLSDFHLMTPTIGAVRNRVIVAGLNSDIYVFAGWSGTFLTSVYSTGLVGNAITTDFSSVSGVTLAVGVENGVSLLTRAAMYYMGGFNNGSGSKIYNYVQRAAIQ